MTYASELDDHPLEVRRGYSGNVLRVWPKRPGLGNVAVTAASVTLYSPGGDAIGGSVALTPVDVDGVSRLDVAVDASDTTTWSLLEGYRADVLYTHASVQHLETIRFACVREPYVPALSINDFLEEVADARQFLEGQAAAIDEDRTAEQQAAVLGVKAWVDVYRRLQARLRDQGRIYPRLIVDRWKIQHVVVAQAIHRLFRAEAGGERVAALAEAWKQEADLRFSSMGDLDYDASDDGTRDSRLTSPLERKLRRAW